VEHGSPSPASAPATACAAVAAPMVVTLVAASSASRWALRCLGLRFVGSLCLQLVDFFELQLFGLDRVEQARAMPERTLHLGVIAGQAVPALGWAGDAESPSFCNVCGCNNLLDVLLVVEGANQGLGVQVVVICGDPREGGVKALNCNRLHQCNRLLEEVCRCVVVVLGLVILQDEVADVLALMDLILHSVGEAIVFLQPDTRSHNLPNVPRDRGCCGWVDNNEGYLAVGKDVLQTRFPWIGAYSFSDSSKSV
jgi:hypothetical protein